MTATARSARCLGAFGMPCLLALLLGCRASVPTTAEPAPRVEDAHQRMLERLAQVRELAARQDPFTGRAQLEADRETLRTQSDMMSEADLFGLLVSVGNLELRQGEAESAIGRFREARELTPRVDRDALQYATLRLGLAYLRLAETQNCVHCRTGESCILPIRPGGVHQQRLGSEKAIEYFQLLLADNPNELTARWLLNLAYMTLGRYPQDVPERFRIDPKKFAAESDFPRFPNIAAALHLDTVSLLGGAVADDFDNDGLIDLAVSGWNLTDQLHVFRNRGDGTFEDRTTAAGLDGITGGCNLCQADYDNDGDIDILVLRGAWRGGLGMYPKSLLQNDGHGNFRDVTYAAGLGGQDFPTQTAAWDDFDLDGDLDVYVGHENFPSQLFVNDGKGHFTNDAERAGVENMRWAKGVAFGDYNADRYPDLYVSNFGVENRLYRNNRDGTFTDVAPELGVTEPLRSFPTWFWDFNNDGLLDLYCSCQTPDVANAVAGYFDAPVYSEHDRLYQGRGAGDDGKGGFQDVSRQVGLTRPTLPMGANYGDLDNDGFLDFYLGTGNPEYESLLPNRMFRSAGGQRFEEVTMAGGFGHLQKGHGVAFADFDNDGDQDVFIQLGGAYPGDAFGDALFENPGFGRHWIRIKLVGTESNRAGVGARIRLDVTDSGTSRSIYRWVNSGGSFGCNPLAQQIGVGDAASIDRIEIYWPKTGQSQEFTNVGVDQFIEIVEGSPEYRKRELRPFVLQGSGGK